MRTFKNKVCFFALVFFSLSIVPAFAEIKIFEKEVEAVVGKGQSQSQVESLVLQRAKRLAFEKAGDYLSTLAAVKNTKLQKDQINAAASCIARALPGDLASYREANGETYIKGRARIELDTYTLDRQIENLMNDPGALDREEKAFKQSVELEDQLAGLKGSEGKKLEELNAWLLALDRERDRQRIFREEQALKAKGEQNRADAERMAKGREIKARLNKILAEQESARTDEAHVLSKEQDRIRRAVLENEYRWNELSRKAALSRESWAPIDGSLPLAQALTQAKELKREMAGLKSRIDDVHGENMRSLQAAYARQQALTKANLPPEPASKDAFESTKEYSEKISAYDRRKEEAQKENARMVEILKREENLKLAEEKVAYLDRQMQVTAPFVERFRNLQEQKFTLPDGGAMTVTLGEPDADNNRFPLSLKHDGKAWSLWWNYSERNVARNLYWTRAYLKAEGIFVIEDGEEIRPKLIAARVMHPGTQETREFSLETPAHGQPRKAETSRIKEVKLQEANGQETEPAGRKKIGTDGRYIAYDNGTVLDTHTKLMWAARDNGQGITWHGAKSYCENFRGGGYADWRLPTWKELEGLYDRSLSGRYHLTPFITLTEGCPWTSETRGSQAFAFQFQGGIRLMIDQSERTDITTALPVRIVK
ncbi:MAG: DUF1566 domain-containing protein [Deltaproteobacteria bacterium]|nr:DUF1566 domain-containing protein [Deltaproteobacteria bacterium]